MDFDTFVFIIELISIAAFAISGAMTAIRAGLDIFGVIIIGVTTAIGGGIFRDLLLGITPPLSFQKPIYATVAATSVVVAFVVESYIVKKGWRQGPRAKKIADGIMAVLDSTGLAIYTIVGISTALSTEGRYNGFLLCFVGVCTGVGGGVLRDLFTGQTPRIFVKHFYASACVIGSIVFINVLPYTDRIPAFIIGAATIIVLRTLAAKFRWNLPKITLPDSHN